MLWVWWSLVLFTVSAISGVIYVLSTRVSPLLNILESSLTMHLLLIGKLRGVEVLATLSLGMLTAVVTLWICWISFHQLIIIVSLVSHWIVISQILVLLLRAWRSTATVFVVVSEGDLTIFTSPLDDKWCISIWRWHKVWISVIIIILINIAAMVAGHWLSHVSTVSVLYIRACSSVFTVHLNHASTRFVLDIVSDSGTELPRLHHQYLL